MPKGVGKGTPPENGAPPGRVWQLRQFAGRGQVLAPGRRWSDPRPRRCSRPPPEPATGRNTPQGAKRGPRGQGPAPARAATRAMLRAWRFFLAVGVVAFLAAERVHDVGETRVLALLVRHLGHGRGLLRELVHAPRKIRPLRPHFRLRLAARHLGLEGLQRRGRRQRQRVQMRDRVVVRDGARKDLAERRRLLVERVHDVLAVVDGVLRIGRGGLRDLQRQHRDGASDPGCNGASRGLLHEVLARDLHVVAVRIDEVKAVEVGLPA